MSLVVVLAIEPIPDEFTSASWPLHVTITTNFTTGLPIGDLVARCQASELPGPLTITPGDDALFGFDRDIPVVLVEPSDVISGLHRRMVAALGADVEWMTPQFLGDGFRPHCTVQRGRQFDGPVVADQLAVVDNAPDLDGTRRRVLHRLSLPGT